MFFAKSFRCTWSSIAAGLVLIFGSGTAAQAAPGCGCEEGVKFPLVIRQHAYFAGTIKNTVRLDGSVWASTTYTAGTIAPDPNRPGRYRATSFGCGEWGQTIRVLALPDQIIAITTDWEEDDEKPDYTEPGDTPPGAPTSNPTTAIDFPSMPCLKLLVSFDGGGTYAPFAHGDAYIREVPPPYTVYLKFEYGAVDHSSAGTSQGPVAGATRRDPKTVDLMLEDIESHCSGGSSALAIAAESDGVAVRAAKAPSEQRGPGKMALGIERAKKRQTHDRPLRDSFRERRSTPTPQSLRPARRSSLVEPGINIAVEKTGEPIARLGRNNPPAPFGASDGKPEAPKRSADERAARSLAVDSVQPTVTATAAPGELLRASIGALRMTLAVGGNAGDLIYEAAAIDENAYGPARLRLVGRGPVATLVQRDGNGALKQIIASSGAIDIVTVSASRFEVRYYDLDDITPTENGFTVDGATPACSWVVENPDSEPAPSRVRFTQTRGLQTHTHVAAWQPAGANDAGRMTISHFDNEIVQERTYYFIAGEEPFRGERTTRRRGLNGPVESDVYEAYGEFYNWGDPGEVFEDIVYRAEGPDLDHPRVTEWTYADDGFIRARVVTSVVHPDGYWERYVYSSTGELVETLSPWLASPSHPSLVNASRTNCRRRRVSYELGPNPDTQEWRKLEEYVPYGGHFVLISKTDVLRTFGETYREDSKAWLDSGGYVWRTQILEGDGETLLLDVQPSGASTRYMREWGFWIPAEGDFSYTSGTGGVPAQRVVIYEGNSTNVFGTANQTLITVRIEDAVGKPFVEEQYVHNGDLFLPGARSDWISRATYTYNATGQVETSSRNGGLVQENAYDINGRLQWSVDESGVRQEYSYDNFGRVSTRVERAGTAVTRTYTYVYDAAGNVVSETVNAGAGDHVLSRTTSTAYDTAGRVISRTTPDALTQRFAEAFLVNGLGHVVRRQVVETRADLSQVLTEYYQDRRLFRRERDISPEYVGYAVAAFSGGPGKLGTIWGYPVTQSFRDLAATQFRVGEWTDMAGNVVREVSPGFSGQSTYNTDYIFDPEKGGGLGAIYSPGQAPRIFEYDGFGRVVREGFDYSSPINWALEPNGKDPVTVTAESYARAGEPQAWYRVMRRSQLQTDDIATETLVAETREQLSGLGAGILSNVETLTAGGRRTTEMVTLDRTSATRTTTSVDLAATGSAAEIRTHVGGVLMSSQDPAAAGPTTYAYWPLGELKSVSDPTGGTTHYSYSPGGQLASVTDTLNRTTAFTYYPQGTRGAGRIATVTDNAGEVTRYEYDSRGRQWRQWGANTYPQQFGYDSDDRLTSLRTFRSADAPAQGGVDWDSATWPANAPAGDLTEWIYHYSGNLERKRYADGTAVIYNYDNAGRVRTRTNARGQVATYSYDSTRSGQLSGVTYGGTTTPSVAILYDRSLRPREITDGSGTRSLSYAPTGQLATESYTSGLLSGQSTTRTYTTFGQPDELQVPGVYSVKWSYDNLARPNGIAGVSGTIADLAVAYGYKTGTGWLDHTEWRRGGTVTLRTSRTYDAAGRLSEVASRDGAANLLHRVHYAEFDPVDRRTKVETEDGGQWEYGYNRRGELNRAQRRDAASAVLPGHDFAFEFDSIGNRRSDRANGAERTYSPNALNQYAQRTIPGQIPVLGTTAADAFVTADYIEASRAGEWFEARVPVDNTQAPVWRQFEVVAVRNNAGENGEDAVATITRTAFVPKNPEVFAHDADGNLTADGRWTYTWDAENRLVSCETNATAGAVGVSRTKLEFVYDAGSRRVAKRTYDWDSASGSWRQPSDSRFLYDGWNLVGEFSAIGATLTLTRSHLWGLDVSGTPQGAGGVGGLLATTTISGAYLPWFEGNGNVTGYSDSSTGEESARFDYGPFGETLVAAGSTEELRFRFSTKYDDESGLLYYGFRSYNPSVGRWPNRDPLEEEGGANLYGFVLNSPVNLVDALGQRPISFYFDAFIHGDRGTWLPEPGPNLSNFYFKTDERGFGQFDAARRNARLFSFGSIESTKIGQAQQGGVTVLNNTGDSHRRRLVSPLIWGPEESKQSPLTTNTVTVKDGPCETTVTITAGAAYPFISVAPNIDYHVEFTFKKLGNGKISVKMKGKRNNFPDYEGSVDGALRYQWKSPSSGPGIINLNTSTSFERSFEIQD
jgi:RHS repeat-associated protein